MAVITPSSLVSEIRGSVGDQTYSRNRYGAYVKAKLIQTNPDSTDQQAVRAQMADAVAEWQSAAQEYQDVWNQFVTDQRIGKNISRKIRRSGFNEFLSRWMNRYALSASGTGFSPLPLVRFNPVITAVTPGTLSIELAYDTLRPIGDCDIAVYATHPISAGINQINKSFYRCIGSFTPGSQVGTEELYTMYTDKFPLTGGDIGKKIGIAIRAINSDNYAAGGFFFVPIIISGGLVSTRKQVQLFNNDYYASDYSNFLKSSAAEQSHINLTRGKLWKFYNY